MEQDHKTIVVERPTGPRITAEEPRSLGELVSVRARTVSKSIVATAITAAATGVAVLTRHKFATAIGASAITAVATHFVVAIMLMGVIGSGGGTVTGYTGPGDIVSGAKNYWAPDRCFSSATTGSISDIVDSATGNTTGTRLQCGAGGVITEVVSGSACTFVTGNACSALSVTCAVGCKIITLYDQGADAKNMTQATNSKRPTYLTLGGSTCTSVSSVCFAHFSGGQNLTASLNTYATTTTILTAKYTGTTQDCAFGSGSVLYQAPGYNLSGVTPNTAFIFNNATIRSETASDNFFHNLASNMTAVNSTLTVDGVAGTPTALGNEGLLGTSFIGDSDGSSNPFHGDIGELAVYNTSIGSLSTISSNSKTYFGY